MVAVVKLFHETTATLMGGAHHEQEASKKFTSMDSAWKARLAARPRSRRPPDYASYATPCHLIILKIVSSYSTRVLWNGAPIPAEGVAYHRTPGSPSPSPGGHTPSLACLSQRAERSMTRRTALLAISSFGAFVCTQHGRHAVTHAQLVHPCSCR